MQVTPTSLCSCLAIFLSGNKESTTTLSGQARPKKRRTTCFFSVRRLRFRLLSSKWSNKKWTSLAPISFPTNPKSMCVYIYIYITYSDLFLIGLKVETTKAYSNTAYLCLSTFWSHRDQVPPSKTEGASTVNSLAAYWQKRTTGTN